MLTPEDVITFATPAHSECAKVHKKYRLEYRQVHVHMASKALTVLSSLNMAGYKGASICGPGHGEAVSKVQPGK